MSRTNETRHTKWHEACRCKCRLDSSVCNNKRRLNDDKYRSECKELIDKGISDNRFMCDPSYWECECNKSCNTGKYLHYKNCKRRNKLVDKLVEKCSENINGNQETNNDYENICNSCTVSIVLLVTAL